MSAGETPVGDFDLPGMEAGLISIDGAAGVDGNGRGERREDRIGGGEEKYGRGSSEEGEKRQEKGSQRVTPAEAQRGMTLIENQIRDLDLYAGDVQDRVRAELGSTSIPPQQQGDELENAERSNEHYKEVSKILMVKARAEAEKCIPENEDFKSAERVTFIRRDELERLKLANTDPELSERQWQMISDIKSKLLDYPVLLGKVVGDEKFLREVKQNYESMFKQYDVRLARLIDDVFSLHMTCHDHVENLLEKFAEKTLKPAINIVKLQHERLETELGEANERTVKLNKRVEELETEAKDAGAEKMRLDREYQAREESLTEEIAALKKKLEAGQQLN